MATKQPSVATVRLPGSDLVARLTTCGCSVAKGRYCAHGRTESVPVRTSSTGLDFALRQAGRAPRHADPETGFYTLPNRPSPPKRTEGRNWNAQQAARHNRDCYVTTRWEQMQREGWE